MYAFKDFGIKQKSKSFVGEKIRVSKILDKEVKVIDFKITKSKLFKENGDSECLYLQIELNDKFHVVFTGSKYLIDMINEVSKDKFPFTTTIVEENKIYSFT